MCQGLALPGWQSRASLATQPSATRFPALSPLRGTSEQAVTFEAESRIWSHGKSRIPPRKNQTHRFGGEREGMSWGTLCLRWKNHWRNKTRTFRCHPRVPVPGTGTLRPWQIWHSCAERCCRPASALWSAECLQPPAPARWLNPALHFSWQDFSNHPGLNSLRVMANLTTVLLWAASSPFHGGWWHSPARRHSSWCSRVLSYGLMEMPGFGTGTEQGGWLERCRGATMPLPGTRSLWGRSFRGEEIFGMSPHSGGWRLRGTAFGAE